MAALTVRAADPAGSIVGKRGDAFFPAWQNHCSPKSTRRDGCANGNRYADQDVGKLYQEFEGGSIGTGVAIGDYDGDGRPDILW